MHPYVANRKVLFWKLMNLLRSSKDTIQFGPAAENVPFSFFPLNEDYLCFKLIQDGGRRTKMPTPIRFLLVTFTNVKTSPQNFLTFSFSPFATLA